MRAAKKGQYIINLKSICERIGLIGVVLLLSSCATYPRTVNIELSNLDYPENTFIEVTDLPKRVYVKDYKDFELTSEQKAEVDSIADDYWKQ